MKNLLIACAVLLAACSTSSEKKAETTPSVHFTAKLSGTTDGMLTISGHGFEQEMEIKDSLTTADLEIPKAGVYQATARRRTLELYLEPGDSLTLSAYYTILHKDPELVSKHEARQAYLTSKAKLGEELFGYDKFDLTAGEFLEAVANSEKEMTAMLADQSLPAAFVTQQKSNASYQAKRMLLAYPLYTGMPKDSLPTEFLTAVDDINLTDEEVFLHSAEYQDLVKIHFDSKVMEDTTVTYTEAFLAQIETLPSGAIKNEMLKGTFPYLFGPNEEMEEMYAFFNEHSTNEKHRAEIKEQYESYIPLQKGKPSPAFAYENHAGGTTSLDQLKGNYVYIDVWATWCGPCKAEIPHLKELEEAYHDKNIDFVSISIDNVEDHDKWVAMVDDKELKGIQLMADKAWKSTFVTDYKINGIPRFILLDPDGKIVTADAPRPSSEEIKTLLESLDLSGSGNLASN